jgi:hypothetical protein
MGNCRSCKNVYVARNFIEFQYGIYGWFNLAGLVYATTKTLHYLYAFKSGRK